VSVFEVQEFLSKSAWTPGQARFIREYATPPFEPLAAVAARAHVAVTSVWTWHQRVPGFRDACTGARAAAEEYVSQGITERIIDGAAEALDVKFAILRDRKKSAYVRDQVATWMLERVIGKVPEKRINEMSGPGGGPIQTESMKAPIDYDEFDTLFDGLMRYLVEGDGARSPDHNGHAESVDTTHTDR